MTELAYRVYPSTPESVESLKHVVLKNEVHIVLAFARDYDATGSQNGIFVPYFNPNFTPKWIREFNKNRKLDERRVKFFLSIGGRNKKYPFYIPPNSRDAWVNNAKDSLKDIVKNYGFDGIDVYYEQVTPGNENDFVKAIGEVISELKLSNENVITTASLAIPYPLSLYEALYEENPALFDHVVFQIHTWPPISTVDELVQDFEKRKPPHPKVFVGHSLLPSDWKNVPRPIFFDLILWLLEKGLIVGISEWSVTDHDPEP